MARTLVTETAVISQAETSIHDDASAIRRHRVCSHIGLFLVYALVAALQFQDTILEADPTEFAERLQLLLICGVPVLCIGKGKARKGVAGALMAALQFRDTVLDADPAEFMEGIQLLLICGVPILWIADGKPCRCLARSAHSPNDTTETAPVPVFRPRQLSDIDSDDCATSTSQDDAWIWWHFQEDSGAKASSAPDALTMWYLQEN
jgi:hypothetical protein